MQIEIIWSEKAALDFENIIDFLLNKWNWIVANNFIDSIDSNLLLISQNPLLCQSLCPYKLSFNN
jgi:plasmid stabilization system protein ParE